ncbi:MAG: precorrin-6A/cobalt-precorrin-6A reductase [Tateyamaria sp.]
MKRVLILGGSAMTDAAARVLSDAGYAVSVYWSRDRLPLDVPDAQSLRDGLDQADALIDATHPFDAPLRGIAVSMAPDVPRIRVGRAPWTPEPGDRWTEVATLPEAVAALPTGARVFAASGRDSAEVLAHHDGPVFLRQLHAHDDPAPDGCTFVFGSGPFDTSAEAALFEKLGIDIVLARNTGGERGFPKIAAARRLGLPVLLLSQPTFGLADMVTNTDALLAWMTRH